MPPLKLCHVEKPPPWLKSTSNILVFHGLSLDYALKKKPWRPSKSDSHGSSPPTRFFGRPIMQFFIKINSSRLLEMYWIILSRRTYWTQPVQKDGAQWIKSILWDYFWCHAFIFSTSISFTAIDARQVHIFFKISNAQQCIYFGLIVRFVN